MKTKDWQQLSSTDFEIKNPDWIPFSERYRSGQWCRGYPWYTPPPAPKADDTAVKHLIDLLRGWLERLPEIASETETFLQIFLPGRKISSNELALWDVTLYTNDGKASYAAFFF
jgi:hypothetical protein